MVEEDGSGARRPSGDKEAGTEKHIGRRAFLGLLAAGILALFLGPNVFSRLSATSGSGGFRINSIRTPDPIDLATWQLAVTGLVRTPLQLSWQEFSALPQTGEKDDFLCVEGWGVKGVEWTGVRVREVLDRAGLDPSATHLVFLSSDLEYYDALTVAQARTDDVLLAHELNGEPLAFEHGWPVRLVTPGLYGYKYVKWVMRIDAVAEPDKSPEGYPGYWGHRGYPAAGTIK
jgi:methionine sulfoxide reductase catalytic subunit